MSLPSQHPLNSISSASQFHILKALAFSQRRLTGVELADSAGIHQTTVGKYIQPLIDAGLVEHDRIGHAHQYCLANDNVISRQLVKLFQLDKSLLPEFKQKLAGFVVSVSKADILSSCIFGSVARGEDMPESDVDVFVLVARNSQRIKNKLFSFTDTIMGKQVSFQVVGLTEFKKQVQDKNALVDELLKDGIHLTGKDLLEIVRDVNEDV